MIYVFKNDLLYVCVPRGRSNVSFFHAHYAEVSCPFRASSDFCVVDLK